MCLVANICNVYCRKSRSIYIFCHVLIQSCVCGTRESPGCEVRNALVTTSWERTYQQQCHFAAPHPSPVTSMLCLARHAGYLDTVVFRTPRPHQLMWCSRSPAPRRSIVGSARFESPAFAALGPPLHFRFYPSERGIPSHMGVALLSALGHSAQTSLSLIHI